MPPWRSAFRRQSVNVSGHPTVTKPMPTPKKKFKSQTRSTKTKATHPDPPAASKKGIGHHPMDFSHKRKAVPVESWWIPGALPECREQFITLAHARNAEMLENADHAWAKIERLHHIGEV